jgi:hypothetical protein
MAPEAPEPSPARPQTGTAALAFGALPFRVVNLIAFERVPGALIVTVITVPARKRRLANSLVRSGFVPRASS